MNDDQLRVVVADDEPLLVRELVAYLTDMGHSVVGTASTGRQLLERSREFGPDLIITDIKMPEMDGLEAARQICDERSVPVIVISAYHDAEFIADQTQTDYISSYLVKPIDERELVTAVAAAVDGESGRN